MDDGEVWKKFAADAINNVRAKAKCPSCGNLGIRLRWQITDLELRNADVDLHCEACQISKQFEIQLASHAPAFFPRENAACFFNKMQDQLEASIVKIQQHASIMPAVAFTTSSLWRPAKWIATTFQWHPTGEAPPILGLVFDDAASVHELFAILIQKHGNADRLDELRVCIIEGSPPGQRQGYTVHLSPDPECLAAYATGEDFVLDASVVPFLAQWNRMYPPPSSPPLLKRFKQEFEKHQEYLLAPVTKRADGQLWVDVELGIIKKRVEFKQLEEIKPDDLDAAALLLPQFITPRNE